MSEITAENSNGPVSATATTSAEPTVAVAVTTSAPVAEPISASGPPATFKDAIKAVPILGWVALGGSFF